MKISLILSQVLTLAAASLPTIAPRLHPEHIIAAVFAVGLGCILRTDYARRVRPLLAAPATRRTEALTLAA